MRTIQCDGLSIFYRVSPYENITVSYVVQRVWLGVGKSVMYRNIPSTEIAVFEHVDQQSSVSFGHIRLRKYRLNGKEYITRARRKSKTNAAAGIVSLPILAGRLTRQRLQYRLALYIKPPLHLVSVSRHITYVAFPSSYGAARPLLD